MNSFNLPADDQASAASPFDRLLQLELQAGIRKVFYQSCDAITHDLLTKCQWEFKTSEAGLVLEIACSDAATYEGIREIQAQMDRSLQGLFTDPPQIQICPPDRSISAAEPVVTTSVFEKTNSETIAPSLFEQINYFNQEIHQVVLAKDQRGQFSLICIAAGEGIPTHATLQGTVIYVLEGQGRLNQAGTQTLLRPGSFVYVPPKTSQALRAIENLAVLCAWV